MKTSAIAVLGAPTFAQERKPIDPPRRIKKGGLFYRRLGRTDLWISEVSLGGSPVPSEPVFRKAVEMGVNYVDTSSSYMGGNSEELIGRMIKGRRDRFHVATKFHPRRKGKTRKEYIEEVEGSLARLDTDYVDVLLVHGASDPEILADEEVLSTFEQLKEAGKIRFTGVSCHRDPVGVLTPAVKSGRYDMITVGYNAFSGAGIEKGKVYDDYLKRSGIEQVIELARERDVGVVAMKTMAGGACQNLDAFKAEGVTLPQAKLKWVLKNESVSAVITEMVTFDMLHENLAVSGAKIEPEEEEALEEYVKAASRGCCRMCGTCMKACPAGIPVPDIIRCGVYLEQYGKIETARRCYRALPASSFAEACDQCGRCEEACPHGISVVRALRRAHRLLA